MALDHIHPSQTRFSCELCRRQKAKCQRIRRNDPKCARCTILRVECTPGQQRKVGRPKQRADSSKGVSTIPGSESSSIIKQPLHRRLNRQKQQIARNTLGTTRDLPPFMNGPTPMLITAAPNTFIPPPAWPTVGIVQMHQNTPTWNFTNIINDDFPLANFDSTFGFATAHAPSLDKAANEIPYASATPVIPGLEGAGDNIETSETLATLSKINLELHVRVAAAEINKTILDFNSLIYQNSPLFIDKYTLAVFTLKASQDFVQILMQLLNSRQCHELPSTSQKPGSLYPESMTLQLQPYLDNVLDSNPTSSPPYFSAALQPMLAPLSLTIISIFTQLISVYGLFLEHFSTRIERFSTDPIAPIPGIMFGGLPLDTPCMQGMLFFNGVIHLLETMEWALGISEREDGTVGLLSDRQVEILWRELDGGLAITPGGGTMRPADVRKLLGKMAMILNRLSVVHQPQHV
ncbi:hypothetical protein BDV38DRAFT_233663 [Aspergillus pseudotamarii]|uniref:Zn(2)-C6 fungal-type domain-containing protein n=1 Tax=Aspergillus pseudotamarii TaxID=132259 RepID=A0A5N6TAX6_ASPPS|nr:uncharacterized protein BDV38DRAFT_233663 [Aspergillus pseudotamarii]KAE8143417.1 hypothetical protein BDV38DRAFT_233663 [Aspergillus pseudotamarii]